MQIRRIIFQAIFTLNLRYLYRLDFNNYALDKVLLNKWDNRFMHNSYDL
jgi:hypothetical protein